MTRTRRFVLAALLALTAAAALFAPDAVRAGARTDYCENKITDWLWRGQSFTPPANWHVGLVRATRGYSNSIRSTAVSSGDTTIPATPNGRIYRVTTAGTTGASEPTWCTTQACTTSDGSAVWTEQTTDLEAGNLSNVTEVSGGNYARVQVTSNLTNWAGTQSAGSTSASSGTSGTTSNNGSIAFGAPSANWGVIFAFFLSDANTAGNMCVYSALTVPKTVNNGDPAPVFSSGAMTIQDDN